MEWKDKTCLKCIYNINDVCRKSPPTPVIFTGGLAATYPPIQMHTRACSQYEEAK